MSSETALIPSRAAKGRVSRQLSFLWSRAEAKATRSLQDRTFCQAYSLLGPIKRFDAVAPVADTVKRLLHSVLRGD